MYVFSHGLEKKKGFFFGLRKSEKKEMVGAGVVRRVAFGQAK
jgi:hypothetical protein